MIYVLSGGENLRSVIAVTYPEGSVCTCTNGTKTLKARDTSGKALFNVTVGEWTVKAEDTAAGKSKSVNVSITEEGHCESVTLRYELMLYDRGDEFKDITGGWGSRWPDGSGVVFNSNNMALNGLSGNYYGIASPNNAIDVTNYSKLVVTVLNAVGTCMFGLSRNQFSNVNAIPDAANKDFSSAGTHELDIKSLAGSYYIGLVAKADDNAAFTALSVYLE